MKYLRDTHVWIWWNMHPRKLSRKALSAISRSVAYEELLLSVISVWDVCKLIEKKRLAVSINPLQGFEQAPDMPKMRRVAVSPRIAYSSTTLPQPFHEDPADQIIAATAREENAVVISKDARLVRYNYIQTMW